MSTVTGHPTKDNAPTRLNPYPFWAPRFWHGMLLPDWLKLLARHRFRIHPFRVPLATLVTITTAGNSVLHQFQRFRYGQAIDNVVVDQPPLFIIGYWRSGTTWLHELLVKDPCYAYPTTYECFAANHFLITGTVFPKLFGFLLPSKRPMDDMAVGFNHPQEDEFALISMGAPSPLERMAFPNDAAPHLEFLDMSEAAEGDLAVWKGRLDEFIRCQTYLKSRRLVLKSPTHTGRIRVLREMFPGAQFIHIVRDPQTLFPSNRRLWRALDKAQGLQVPNHRNVDEYIFSAFERMYRGFEHQRAELPAGCLAETRYEDLVSDPLREMERLYSELSLGDFEQVRPSIEQDVASRSDYRANHHELEPELSAEIAQRWGAFQQRYGY